MTEQLAISAAQVGDLIGVSRSKVFELMSVGALPPSFKLGRNRKFRRSDIERWIELGMPSLERFEQLARRAT